MGQDLGGLVFFSLMREYIKNQLDKYVSDALERVIGFTGALALALLTLWIMIEGYRIMTGQSRSPMMGFILQASKAVVIVAIATSSALYNSWVRDTMTDVRDDITYFITGSHQDVYRQVDKNLALAQTILSTVNSIATDSAAETTTAEDKKKAWWLSAAGTAGPAIIAGMVSLLNEIMLSLAVVFGPIFILGLLFEQTKQLFWNWVKYCIGVMCSMGVLAIMTSITLKISIGYAAAVAAGILSDSILHVGAGPSVSQTAMLQGGVGLMLSTLLVTIPPMTMNFFSVSLGGMVNGYGPWTSGQGAAPGTGVAKSEQQAVAGSTNAKQDPGSSPTGQLPSTTSSSTKQDHGSVNPAPQHNNAPAANPPPPVNPAIANMTKQEATEALAKKGWSATAQGNIHPTGDFLQNAIGNMAHKADAGGCQKQVQQDPDPDLAALQRKLTPQKA